ncbi:MAG: hypothetical protein AAFZ09_02750, partial [Pseudomonadota bacterium]
MLPLTPPRVLTLAPVRRLPPPGDGFVEAAVAVTERGEALVLSVEPAGADDVQVDEVLAQLSNPERGLSFLFGVTSGAPALLMG